MKFIISSALIISSFSLFAQRPNVVIIDQDIETQELEPHFNVQRPQRVSSLPDRYTRETLLEEFEIGESWDELKKDIFFMELRLKTLVELKKKYPELSEKKLKEIQERLR